MRTFSALIVGAALVASLAACSSQPLTAADCGIGPKTGDASALVTATGSFGAEPTVDFPTPLITDGIEVTTLITGDGQVLGDSDVADVETYVYEGTSGTFNTSAVLRAQVGAEGNPFSEMIACSTVGSRIAVTVPRDDVFQAGTDGAAVPDDTVVLVMDIKARYLGKANGVDQIPQAGIPAVVTAPNGQPGITIPNETAPTDLKIAVLKQGDGAVVKENDPVVVNYTGVLWDEDTVFDSTWEQGGAVTVVAKTLDPADNTGIVEGFKEALVGQKVGSQVIVVVPPESGFGTGTPPTGVSATSTLVYVFDVLGIQK